MCRDSPNCPPTTPLPSRRPERTITPAIPGSASAPPGWWRRCGPLRHPMRRRCRLTCGPICLSGRCIQSFISETETGRVFLGDVLYVRDLCDPGQAETAARLGPRKLLNLLCTFAAFSLPDCAAEVALKFSSQLAGFCDLERVL